MLKKAVASYYEVTGAIWRKENEQLQKQKDFIANISILESKFKELKADISVADFIENYLQGEELEKLRFTVKNYVEGYYAADTGKASTFALKEELTKPDHKQYRIEGGYSKLINFLHGQCLNKGVKFFLSHAVEQIHWQKNKVEVIFNEKKTSAQKMLITVPVGVLQSEKIQFSPSLPEKINAARKLGYGPVIKIILQFEEMFWKNKNRTQKKDLSKLSFIFSEAIVPTWWTQHPKNISMITGWCGGPHAKKLKELSDEEILQKAIASLSFIFESNVIELEQKLKGWHVANWMNDAYSYGAYSYEVLNGAYLRTIVKQPVAATVYFAGEGLYDGTEIGTVEAALISGRETAHQIISDF